jgi:glutathione S-transferase
MITLVQFAMSKNSTINNFSPYCLKLETYLKAAKIPYQVEPFRGNPNTGAPKGKLPFIRYKGKNIGDSALVVELLKKDFGADLDRGLSPLLTAQSIAFQKMIEEHLGQCLVYFRWQDDAGWDTIKGPFFGWLPFPIKLFVPTIIRGKTVKKLKNGLGAHTREEVLNFMREDLKALDTQLGYKNYFLDDQLRTLDATAYGFLANFYHDINPLLKKELEHFPRLINFVKRVDILFRN